MKAFKNQIQLSGVLGSDPKTVSNGESTFIVMSLAQNSSYFDKKTEQWQKAATQWFEVYCFGNQIKKAAALKQGDKIFVLGELKSYKKEVEGKNITHLSIQALDILRVSNIKVQEDSKIPDFYSDEEISFDQPIPGV